MCNKKILGTTLIELVITIVVIAIAVTGIFSLYIQTIKASAEPALFDQASTIAQSYMEEILPQSFDSLPPNTGGRTSFNDIDDYNNLSDNAGARNRFNIPITGMELYNINVSVTPVASLNGITGNNIKRIVVTVTHDSWATIGNNFSQQITLSAHKAKD